MTNIDVPLWCDIQEALKDEDWLRVDGQAPDLTRQLVASAVVRFLSRERNRMTRGDR